MSRLSGVVLEQARPPAARQDGVGKHETCQIDQLPDVITHAKVFDSEIHYFVGILPGQGGRAADA